MIAYHSIACDPPLGQCTVVPHNEDKITISVLIELDAPLEGQQWEAVLWHNCRQGKEWGGLDLQRIVNSISPLDIDLDARVKSQHYFSGTLQRPQREGLDGFEFTLKYRIANGQWCWANEASQLTNGEIIFQSESLPETLQSCFSRFGTGFDVDEISSESPSTKLWSATFSVDSAQEQSTCSNSLLGVPLYVARWFAIVRVSLPWIGPRHGKGVFRTSEDAIACSFLRRDGLHLVLLAVSALEDTVTVFNHDDFGGVTVSARNDNSKASKATVLAAVGYEQGTALAACMYHARRILSEFTETRDLAKHRAALADGSARTQWMEEWYDGLGYCTWNGLGQKLTEEKIHGALDDLEENGIKITNLIIDDNWQSLDFRGEKQNEYGWADFEANKDGFPRGLEKAVTDIKDLHPSIVRVAVWHAILGYWGGVSPTGSIAKEYKTKDVKKSAGGEGFPPSGTMTVVAADDVQRMYDDFYEFLLKCRIDGVKTDAQCFLDLLADSVDRRELIPAYQDAWTVSNLTYFRARVISCMSQVPQLIFHSQLPMDRQRCILRNSDDFFPNIASSHPWHIFTNAYAAVFTQYLNVLPDWDMFQTSHEFGSFHAAGRCVSGGPIYITDEPGNHDLEVIREITAETVQGMTTTLRTSCIGKVIPQNVYTAYDDNRLLRVGVYHGSSDAGFGLMGIFNVASTALTELVPLRDFPGVQEDRSYVVRAHRCKKISEPLQLSDTAPLTSIKLEPHSWEIMTAYPLQRLLLDNSEDLEPREALFAPLGLLGKMSGAAAILRTEFEPRAGGGLRMQVTLKALGLLGIYLLGLPSMDIDKNFLVLIKETVIPRDTVSKSGQILEIDVETAWKDLNLSPGYNNEVTVDVLVSS